MILFLLILGFSKNCQASEWALGFHQQGEGFNFGEISLDTNSISHDLQNWNPIPNFPKPPLNFGQSTPKYGQTTPNFAKPNQNTNYARPGPGLQAWLQEVNIAKSKNLNIKPVIKATGYPVYKDVPFQVPFPQVQQVQQPYPVIFPVLHPVPYEVIKTVVKTVEKKVPTPVEKIVPVPIEKPVPFEVVKHIPTFVEKKIPIKIPVYKTIHHNVYH